MVTPVILDVSNWTHTKSVLEPIVAEYSISYLVNCAAFFSPEAFGKVEEATVDRSAYILFLRVARVLVDNAYENWVL